MSITGVSEAPTDNELIQFAHDLADAARPVVMALFRTRLDVEAKADESPVTIADRNAEAAMRVLIEKTFPDHGIIGEEHGKQNEDAEYVWVLDPIDGTKSFVTGKPLFGILIALMKNGKPILGVIDMPALGERFIGVNGTATMNGDAVAVRGAKDLKDAWLYTTTPDMFDTDERRAAYGRLAADVRQALFGCDCYAYGLLASGHVDLVCEANMSLYDFAALVPVVEGAGGVITDWQGAALGPSSDGTVLAAATPALHKMALDRLRG